ncbi:unnamed protein product [Meloidogyne enterolobii]|uniref:Uncharacterized protein n=1 Tax=Meloidogyne enterolobii TaxID=390850 RepID=A0ACB1AG10_MELEN
MLNATAHFILPILSLNPIQTFYITSILGCISNFVMACNAPALYLFSKDYKAAFNNRFWPPKSTLTGGGVAPKGIKSNNNQINGSVTLNKNNKIQVKMAW